MDTVRRADGRSDIVVLATNAGLVHIRGATDLDGGPATGVIAAFPLNEPERSYVEAFSFGGGFGDDVLVATYDSSSTQGFARTWVNQLNEPVMLESAMSVSVPARANSIAGLSGNPSYAFIASDSATGIKIVTISRTSLTLNNHVSGSNFYRLHSLQSESLLVGDSNGVVFGSKVDWGTSPETGIRI